MSQVLLLPVRHHSPRSSAVVQAFLERHRPSVVLVEGPADASTLIDIIVDDNTQPPVAILGYRTDGTPASALWPFASYSPEYVALRWAQRNGAQAKFIDMEVGRSLHRQKALDLHSAVMTPQDNALDLHEACAQAAGFRSFEEFWEAAYEAPAHDYDSFRDAILAYADTLLAADDERSFHRARDAVMARRILQAAAESGAPRQVAVVAGAAHVAAFASGQVDLALHDTLPPAVECASTVIPFSFPRLAEQLGYGAGNRAPQYYQRAHDAGCDYRRATLEVLVEFTEHLRMRGFMASLADTIEAYRLAVTLADIRGKTEPGLDEVREATIATMCRGDRAHVDNFLWPSVIGRNVGRVASRIGRNSLQEEFWREVKHRKLPEHDSPEQFTLKLNNEVEVASSIFLHRLRMSQIPYAGFIGAHKEAAGGHAALSRVKETWEAQWTPATDIGLVEKIVFGDSLEAVTTHFLQESLQAATAAGATADVLLEAVVAAIPQIVGHALLACDRLASTDDDLLSLASACRALSALVSYGTSRALSSLGTEAIPTLCRKTFDRALLRIPQSCIADDEALPPALMGLRTLHEIALAQPIVDREAWFGALDALIHSYAVNPQASGLACGLSYLAQRFTDAEVAVMVSQRLSNLLQPEKAASFLAGFLQVNSVAIVKSRPVIQALDAFLCGIPAERFRDTLPMLRRGLGDLGATERRYLLENLFAIRGLGNQSRAAAAVLAEKDKAKLQEISADLASAMGDLDDLL